MKRVIHAPTGTKLNCKGWLQEAAYRMIQICDDLSTKKLKRDLYETCLCFLWIQYWNRIYLY